MFITSQNIHCTVAHHTTCRCIWSSVHMQHHGICLQFSPPWVMKMRYPVPNLTSQDSLATALHFRDCGAPLGLPLLLRYRGPVFISARANLKKRSDATFPFSTALSLCWLSFESLYSSLLSVSPSSSATVTVLWSACHHQCCHYTQHHRRWIEFPVRFCSYS